SSAAGSSDLGIGGDVGGDVGGNASLAEQRAPLWADVERDPATKHLMYQMMATEGGGSATVEALFNRVAMIRKKVPGYSISDELRSGFYGPINTGKAQRTAITPAMRQRYDREIARVLGGSNIIQGRTDQGTFGDPNANGPGRVFFPGMSRREIYNFWKGSRRGRQFTYQDSARFAEEQNARAPASDGLNQPALTQRPEMPTEPPAELNADLQKIKDQRAELEKPITIRAQLDRGQDNQFRRASMRREVNREVREAAYNSYNDIGAA
ncbi:hypothetical protein, partial [Bradyrhizobium sp. Leo121]|uniref:hypothetical protein n=1 Tax=Bradyrhizobium sp. Leo121 TaxID=1571195 RepID=UPI0010DA7DCA